jgi:sulfotransferase famil protein
VTVHFLHIPKTGGTAIKWALRHAGFGYWRPDQADLVSETRHGPIWLHHHNVRLADVPPGEPVFFCVRDPVARFVSGFESRLNKGQPRYDVEWTAREREVFETFRTPQQLASALAGGPGRERRLARRAMTIRHLAPYGLLLGGRREIRARLGQILYIARQETLARDWEQLKAILGLPAGLALPSDEVAAHRREPSSSAALDPEAIAVLRRWYHEDYRVLRYCELLRTWHGWGQGRQSATGMVRLRREATRLRGLPAILPPPPVAVTRRVRPQ